ncbi:hypothetical protein B0F90DRAFT_574622 [Multifurca ochricompacta]|uniref:Uncharacterized protein n=1 Tax=Multifurca ochricompacta TaxID=376703 RepID=A0AAD4M2X8_9AGAM|nr:hypothetical protein B0F90DRAFT_574622 [Multifurca ochricompacta]
MAMLLERRFSGPSRVPWTHRRPLHKLIPSSRGLLVFFVLAEGIHCIIAVPISHETMWSCYHLSRKLEGHINLQNSCHACKEIPPTILYTQCNADRTCSRCPVEPSVLQSPKPNISMYLALMCLPPDAIFLGNEKREAPIDCERWCFLKFSWYGRRYPRGALCMYDQTPFLPLSPPLTLSPHKPRMVLTRKVIGITPIPRVSHLPFPSSSLTAPAAALVLIMPWIDSF